MITVLVLMTTGIVLGMVLNKLPKLLKSVDKLINYAIYLLLFLLGVSVGINDKIINSLDTIGIQALWITLGAIAGSVLVSWGLYHIVFKTNIKKQTTHEK